MTNEINDDLIVLDSIAERYFGITAKMAKRKAALGTLPIPAFRLAGGRRGPMFVRKDDVDALVTKRADAAQALNKKMIAAGAAAS